MTWVQLLQHRTISNAGVSRNYHPGDWVDVGKATAQRWLADGIARTAQPLSADFAGCGVLTLGDKANGSRLRSVYKLLPIEGAEHPETRFARTLIWDTRLTFRAELVSVGLHLLDTWDAAIPLWSYEQLAQHVGSAEARARTQAIIRDLRVPLYDTRLVFVRRNRAGEALVEAWNAEHASGDDDKLCLLRALYQVKPLICALPVTWTGKQVAA